MPRGVPASGVRRTRAFVAAEAAQTSVAFGPEDEPDDQSWSEDDETPDPVDDTPTVIDEDLTEEDPTVEVPPIDVPVVDEVVEAPVVLTPEQREIKMLRDQLARERGRKDVEPEPVDLTRPGDETNILIHFLEDGLTVNGKVMYRGDELEFEVGSQAYKDTCDRNGKTFLDLRGNDFAQVERWDRVMFRSGPWPGKTYSDGKYEALRVADGGQAYVSPPTEAEIAAAEKARLRRAAPRLPAQV